MYHLQKLSDSAKSPEDWCYEHNPVGVSEFELWCRLDGLAFVEEAPSDDIAPHCWPVILCVDERHGWAIMVNHGDPRLPAGGYLEWDERLIGVGETVVEALEAAERWACDKPNSRPWTGDL